MLHMVSMNIKRFCRGVPHRALLCTVLVCLAPGMTQGAPAHGGDPSLSLQVMARHPRPDATIAEFLLDDQGVLRSGDGVQVRFTLLNEAYVYVVMYGSTDTATLLFPPLQRQLKQKLPGQRTYVIPSRDDFFMLDDNSGEEILIAFSTSHPIPHVDTFLRRLESQGRDLTRIISTVREVADEVRFIRFQHIPPKELVGLDLFGVELAPVKRQTMEPSPSAQPTPSKPPPHSPEKPERPGIGAGTMEGPQQTPAVIEAESQEDVLAKAGSLISSHIGADTRQAQLTLEKERRTRARLEQERLAREQVERERLALEQAERKRLVLEQAERERLTREQPEEGSVAPHQTDWEQPALEQAERERLALEQAERERLAREQSEPVPRPGQPAQPESVGFAAGQTGRLSLALADQERVVREPLESERLALERAERERLLREQAERERQGLLARAEQERLEQEQVQAERERLALEQARRQPAYNDTGAQQPSQDVQSGDLWEREQAARAAWARERDEQELLLSRYGDDQTGQGTSGEKDALDSLVQAEQLRYSRQQQQVRQMQLRKAEEERRRRLAEWDRLAEERFRQQWDTQAQEEESLKAGPTADERERAAQELVARVRARELGASSPEVQPTPARPKSSAAPPELAERPEQPPIATSPAVSPASAPVPTQTAQAESIESVPGAGPSDATREVVQEKPSFLARLFGFGSKDEDHEPEAPAPQTASQVTEEKSAVGGDGQETGVVTFQVKSSPLYSQKLDATPQERVEHIQQAMASTSLKPALTQSVEKTEEPEDIPSVAPILNLPAPVLDEAVETGVALVVTPTERGAGILLDLSGYILTNWHLVQDYPFISVLFRKSGQSQVDMSEVYTAQVVKTNKLADLALIKLQDAVPDGVTALPFATSPPSAQGDVVYVLGLSDDGAVTAASGVVGRMKRNNLWYAGHNVIHRGNVIQIDGVVSPQAEGGPLLNTQFEVIGVNAYPGRGKPVYNALAMDSIKEFLRAGGMPQTVAVP